MTRGLRLRVVETGTSRKCATSEPRIVLNGSVHVLNSLLFATTFLQYSKEIGLKCINNFSHIVAQVHWEGCPNGSIGLDIVIY
jgi:hypothetical protein